MENKYTKDFVNVLNKVQKELPIVNRTTKAYKYKYAPLEEVWGKIKEVINGNGFSIINEVSEKGITTTAIHEHGILTSFISFSSENLNAQDRGSEITYARRYNITAIFNVVIENEDDDAQEIKPVQTQKPIQKSIKKTLTAFDSAENALNKCNTLEELEKTSKQVQESKVLSEEEKAKLVIVGGSVYDSLTK